MPDLAMALVDIRPLPLCRDLSCPIFRLPNARQVEFGIIWGMPSSLH